MTDREIMKALLDGKKVSDRNWKNGEYIHLVDSRLTDEGGDNIALSDCVFSDTYIFGEPKQKEERWLRVYLSFNGKPSLCTVFYTEEEAKEAYDDRLICKYGESIEMEVE